MEKIVYSVILNFDNNKRMMFCTTSYTEWQDKVYSASINKHVLSISVNIEKNVYDYKYGFVYI